MNADYLDENREKNDSDRCCYEFLLSRYLRFIENERQGESDGSAQTTIRHDDHVDACELE
jgi:hypothetical protein